LQAGKDGRFINLGERTNEIAENKLKIASKAAHYKTKGRK
jgi:hypothetical protein